MRKRASNPKSKGPAPQKHLDREANQKKAKEPREKKVGAEKGKKSKKGVANQKPKRESRG